MTKNILYIIAFGFLSACGYYSYYWYVSDPTNKEPLPAILNLVATIIMGIIAWQFDGTSKDDVTVDSIGGEAYLDIDPKKDTNIKVKNVKGKSTVLINKGKGSLR
jgi:hypothetical protein